MAVAAERLARLERWWWSPTGAGFVLKGEIYDDPQHT